MIPCVNTRKKISPHRANYHFFLLSYIHHRHHLPTPHLYASDSVNLTSPLVAPPTQVLSNVPVGHVSLAALTQRSHRPLEMLIVAPLSVVDRSKRAVPLSPVVLDGLPPHFWIDPAMPPQMDRMATLVSWVSRLLLRTGVLAGVVAGGEGGRKRGLGEGEKGRRLR